MILLAAPRKRSSVPIDGIRLRSIRERKLVMSQREFADAVGMSEPSIRDLESGRTASTYARNFRKIAEVLGITLEDAKQQLSRSAEWDTNVEPFHQQHIPQPIPEFDLPIAAGGWSHVTDNHTGGITCTAEQRRQGLFRVRIRGDSMTPRFRDGDLVEFKLLCTPEGLPDFEAMREGEAYYVQKNDGEGTFKICQRIEPEKIILAAINRRYRKPLTATLGEIVSVGRYEHKCVK